MRALALLILAIAGGSPPQAAPERPVPTAPKSPDVPKASDIEEFKLIHVEDLAGLMADREIKLAIFDANGPELRAKEGIIPGAKLLPSFRKYDVAKELPQDKATKLVFYCADVH
jgi:hypothetical protein